MGSDKVVIILFQYSVVVKGIENRLKEMGYEVYILNGKFDLVSTYAPDTSLFITYLPGDITDDDWKMNNLLRISENVINGGSQMIILGESTFHAELLQKLPDIEAFEWVNKPVDMGHFSETVEKLINERNNPSARKRILIVDDDPSYAKMVREWIKDDYRVDIVTAGMQAISFLLKVKEDEKVDLILLDYEMPVVDGPQVLQMLRQEPETSKIPVIFLTGIGTKEAVSRVMELKPSGYVLKSTSREDLLLYLRKKVH